MTTRLEDAVISVKIETEQARAELDNLSTAVGKIDDAQNVTRRRAGVAGGGPAPSVIGGGAPTPGPAVGKPTQVPGHGAGASTGGFGVGREVSSLEDPFRHVKHLRNIGKLNQMASSTKPTEIIKEMGGLMEELPGFLGVVGTAFQVFSKGLDVAAATAALAASYETKTLGAIKLGYKSSGDPDDQEPGWAVSKLIAATNATDQAIVFAKATNEAFAETRAQNAMVGIAGGGQGYGWGEWMDVYSRNHAHITFQSRLNRRATRTMAIDASGATKLGLGDAIGVDNFINFVRGGG